MQPGTRGNPDGHILVVGEVFSSSDEAAGQAFAGSTGKELEAILREAGLDPADCLFTNVLNKRPPGGNIVNFFHPHAVAKKHHIMEVRGLHPDIPILEGIQLLDDLIAEMQPKVIIALGNYALWALTEDSFTIANGDKPTRTAGYKVPSGIVKFRGSHLRHHSGTPIVPTFHPAVAFKNYEWRFLMVHDIRARTKRALNGTWDEPQRDYIIRPTFDQVMEVINDLILRATLSPTPLIVAADIETKPPNLECIGFAWSKTEAICIPIMCNDKWDGYWSAWEEVEIVLAMKRLMEHPNIEIVGQNFFYDYQYLFYYWNIRSSYKQDTMLAQHVVFPALRMSLDFISSLYCDFHNYWKEDGKEATKQHNDEQRWTYNCRDCVVTYEAIESLWELIDRYNLQMQYAIQMVRANSAVGMMVRGIKVDERRRGQERIHHIETASEYEQKLTEILPPSVHKPDPKKAAWYRSPQQQKEIFYDTLMQKPVIDRKTGQPTTNDDALNKIGQREPALLPLTQLLQEYRSLKVFGDFLNMKVGQDGRMRANFSPTTETFRYRSSSDVFGYGRNLQNLPVGNEEED